MTAQGMSAFGENSRSEVEGEARQPGGEAMRPNTGTNPTPQSDRGMNDLLKSFIIGLGLLAIVVLPGAIAAAAVGPKGLVLLLLAPLVILAVFVGEAVREEFDL